MAFKLLGFVVLALLARMLSRDDYGKLMFSLTLSSVAVLLTDFGASSDLVRRVAASPAGARRRIEAVLSARLPLLGVYMLLLCAWVAATKPDVLVVAAVIAVYSALKDLYRTYSSLFLGLHRVVYMVAAYGVKLLVLAGGVALGAALDRGLAWVTGCYIASGVVLLLTSAAIARACVGPLRLRWRWSLMKRVFGKSMYLFALSLMSLVHFGADTLMLGYLKPFAEVATYEAAAKLLEASQFMVRPITLILFPICAGLAARRRWDELRRLMHKMLGGMAGVGLIACAAAALLATPVIHVVYTQAYDESAVVLRVLYLSVPGLYVATICMFLASSMHRERRAVLVMTAGVVFKVAVNLYVLPRYGALGAAWTTVASQNLVAAWMVVDAYRGVARHAPLDEDAEQRLEAEMELGHE